MTLHYRCDVCGGEAQGCLRMNDWQDFCSAACMAKWAVSRCYEDEVIKIADALALRRAELAEKLASA